MDDNIYYSRGNFHLPEESEESSCNNCTKGGCNKLDVCDWFGDIPQASDYDVVEIRFKNTRKAFYKNVNNLRLRKGDIVAVEASPGHDIGIVSLTGELVKYQIKKLDYKLDEEELKKIYRKAKDVDIEKWKEAMRLEFPTMLKARKIASDLNLDMKIGDVEYQGDKTKAIFYYYAEDRVDFRELIKIFAETFKVRIEMRQIGARQEAGRIGGLGTCGRELCCTTWMSNFISVTTNAARYQEISLNPQKLAGQCSKLKCCLNYELKSYLDARENFPDSEVPLETTKGPVYHQKNDIFKKIMWYSYNNNKESNTDLIPIPVERVREIMKLNKEGKKVNELVAETQVQPAKPLDFNNVVGQDSLTRFEEKRKNEGKKRRRRR